MNHVRLLAGWSSPLDDDPRLGHLAVASEIARTTCVPGASGHRSAA